MMTKDRIYLDYAATTPVDPRVFEAMLPYFSQQFGNPSSMHYFGQLAESALDESRQSIANTLHCSPDEVIFTSCGSESDNLALRGGALAVRQKSGANHILISPVEHHAVSHTALQFAELYGFEVEFLPVDHYGIVDPQDVAKRIRANTALVSIIYANNEIGTINPISEIGGICHNAGVLFHSDAVQATAYCTMDVQALNLDMVSIGAHKFYGPKGVGVLYVRQGTPIIPIQTGGGQEHGLRAGTSNIPYIVGMAKALEIAQQERLDRTAHLQILRDHLITEIMNTVDDTQLTGHQVYRLPNHASFVFKNVDGNTLLMLLDVNGIACSSGSACKTGDPEPSEILVALGFSREWALGSLRVSMGTGTMMTDIDTLLSILPEQVNRARKLVAR